MIMMTIIMIIIDGDAQGIIIITTSVIISLRKFINNNNSSKKSHFQRFFRNSSSSSGFGGLSSWEPLCWRSSTGYIVYCVELYCYIVIFLYCAILCSTGWQGCTRPTFHGQYITGLLPYIFFFIIRWCFSNVHFHPLVIKLSYQVDAEETRSRGAGNCNPYTS